MYYLVVVLSVFLIGCGGSESSHPVNIRDITFGGTWEISRESKEFNKSASEYIGTTSRNYSIQFWDTEDGTKFSECGYFGDFLPTVIKTDEYLYLGEGDVGFYVNSEGVLQREVIEFNGDDPDIEYRVTEHLVKKSNLNSMDEGGLSIIGRFNLNEQNTACVVKFRNDSEDTTSHLLYVPYEKSPVLLVFSFSGEMEIGEYEFIRYPRSEKITNFSIDFFSEDISMIVGGNTLNPDSATINVIEISKDKLVADYELVSFSGVYSGRFEMKTD